MLTHEFGAGFALPESAAPRFDNTLFRKTFGHLDLKLFDDCLPLVALKIWKQEKSMSAASVTAREWHMRRFVFLTIHVWNEYEMNQINMYKLPYVLKTNQNYAFYPLGRNLIHVPTEASVTSTPRRKPLHGSRKLRTAAAGGWNRFLKLQLKVRGGLKEYSKMDQNGVIVCCYSI